MSRFYGGALHKLLALTLPPLPVGARLHQLLLVAALIGLGLAIAWLPPLEIALFLGGVLFLILVLLKPSLPVYLLIPIIPFSPLFSVTVGGFKIGLMEIVLALGLAAWLLRGSMGARIERMRSSLTSPEQRGIGPGQPSAPFADRFAPVLLWPFLIFLGGVGLSWLNTVSIGASLVETVKWIEMLLLYLLVVALLPVREVKWVVLVLLLSGMAQAVLGLYQFIFKVGPPGFLLFDGRFLRAYGTFAQPNPFAGYLGLILPLSLAVALWGLSDDTGGRLWRWGRWGNLKRVVWVVPLGLLLLALLASQSRGGWLGFAIAAGVTFTIYSKRTAAITALVTLVGTTLALVGLFDLGLAGLDSNYELITGRLVDAFSILTISDVAGIEVNDANFALIERLAHWQAAREMWRDNLWLGVGFGNYAVIYPAYAVGRWLNPLGHAHNYLLNIGAETGLVGITAYLIFWIFAFGVSWLTVRRSHGFARAVAAGGLGVMVHLHVHNLFDNLYVQGMYLHIAIVLALVSVIYHHRSDLTKSGRNQAHCPTKLRLERKQ